MGKQQKNQGQKKKQQHGHKNGFKDSTAAETKVKLTDYMGRVVTSSNGGTIAAALKRKWVNQYFAGSNDNAMTCLDRATFTQAHAYFRDVQKYHTDAETPKELALRRISKHFHRLGNIHVKAGDQHLVMAYVVRYAPLCAVVSLRYPDNAVVFSACHFDHVIKVRTSRNQEDDILMHVSQIKTLHQRRQFLRTLEQKPVSSSAWGIVCEYAEPTFSMSRFFEWSFQ